MVKKPKNFFPVTEKLLLSVILDMIFFFSSNYEMSAEQQWSMVDKNELALIERRMERLEGKMEEILVKMDQVLLATSAEGRSRTYNQMWRLFPGYINPTIHNRMQEHITSDNHSATNQLGSAEYAEEEVD